MTVVEIQLLVLAAAGGSVIGSYLNVVAYRLPAGVSTVWPRSRCPRCVMPIRPWDNVPVLGHLWLRGRCRDCGAKISWRYPAVEVFCGVMAVACLRRFGPSLTAALAFLFAAALVVLALIDIDYRRVPQVVALPLLVVGLVAQPELPWTTLASALLAAALAAVALFVLSLVWRWRRRQTGLAGGDVLVAAALGSWMGLERTIEAVLAASAAVIVAASLLRLRRAGRERQAVPFVAYLAGGAMLVLWWTT